jgi:hypothetical protein
VTSATVLGHSVLANRRCAAPRRAGRDSLPLPRGYRERGAVAGCVRNRQCDRRRCGCCSRACHIRRMASSGRYELGREAPAGAVRAFRALRDWSLRLPDACGAIDAGLAGRRVRRSRAAGRRLKGLRRRGCCSWPKGAARSTLLGRRPRGSERGRRRDCSDRSQSVVFRRLNGHSGASAHPANGTASSGGPDGRWSSMPVVWSAGSETPVFAGRECRESRDDGSGAPLVPAT